MAEPPAPHAGLRGGSLGQPSLNEDGSAKVSDAEDAWGGPGYMLMKPVYPREYLERVAPTHKPPQRLFEKTGFWAVQSARWTFDRLTGYSEHNSEKVWLHRMLFLETVAGVPGFVAGMLRHMRSLRSMRRDNGWIHTLLEEAENERMHLLTFLQFIQPGPFMRFSVLAAQGIFFNAYLFFYLLSPRHCHAFVGYLEEEAIKTYTHCLREIDAGNLADWDKRPAPLIARNYWHLAPDATMRDVILNVRADEACHSYVNHTFSQMKASDENPFVPGTHQIS